MLDSNFTASLYLIDQDIGPGMDQARAIALDGSYIYVMGSVSEDNGFNTCRLCKTCSLYEWWNN